MESGRCLPTLEKVWRKLLVDYCRLMPTKQHLEVEWPRASDRERPAIVRRASASPNPPRREHRGKSNAMIDQRLRALLPLFAAVFIDIFSFGLMYSVIIALFHDPIVVGVYRPAV